VKRVYVGCILFEANTFSPVRTGLQAFKDTYLAEGEATRELVHANVEVGGFYREMEKADGVATVAGFVSWGVPGGTVAREAFAELSARLFKGIRGAGRLDGLYLSLHGAMAAEGEDDCEGFILHTARRIVGDSVPIVASVDWHACMTRRMVENADLFVGYRTYPHTDLADTGGRAARCMLDLLSRGRSVRKLFARIPMIVPVEKCSTDRDPSAELIRRLSQMDRLPGVISVVHSMTNPWTDVPGSGTSVLVCCEQDADTRMLSEKRDEVLRFAWESRGGYASRVPDTGEFLSRLASLEKPASAVDLGDIITAGSPGDSTFLLREFLARGLSTRILMAMVDPAAARQAFRAGPESELTLALGSAAAGYNAKVMVRARVLATSDRPFTPRGAALHGMKVDPGLRAILATGPVRLLVIEHTAFLHDPEAYRSMGQDPAWAELVVQKSHQLFKPAWAGIMKSLDYVDTPGPSSRDLAGLGYRKVERPIFPLDDFDQFRKAEEYIL
jgi:microcystin degradation protein MlrC